MPYKIAEDLQQRVPLMKPEWMGMILKMRENSHAPRWNALCGDRLQQNDLVFIQRFEEQLINQRHTSGKTLSPNLLHWLSGLKERSLWFREALSLYHWPERFTEVKTMERKDLQNSLANIVPLDQALSRLIINPTSGTTGQPILCPNHPRAVGCYDPMIQFALRQNSVQVCYDHFTMAAIQICAQSSTITYNTVHSYLNGAGFAKINLSSADWNKPEDPALFIQELSPVFLSGDPFSFYQAMAQGITYHPQAILSTALHLDQALRDKLNKHFQCPVINFYSLNETGPIAYSCPDDPEALHIISPDIYLETLDETGQPAANGTIGEITVTGGRNPFMPLLRYKTGDYGILDHAFCSCGDPMPKIRHLQGRKMVLFEASNGQSVNPIDISRILKNYPVLQHQMCQLKNKNILLRLYPENFLTQSQQQQLKQQILTLFGNIAEIEILFDLDPFDRKIIPFVRE